MEEFHEVQYEINIVNQILCNMTGAHSRRYLIYIFFTSVTKWIDFVYSSMNR